MIRLVLSLGAAVLLAASGVTHRLWTGEWTVSNGLAEASARLAEVPLDIGNGAWEGTDTEVDPQQLKRAEATSFLSRRYVQRGTGKEVSVFMICGRPGPVSVHTPDVCYGGIGFQIQGAQNHYDGDGKTLRVDFAWANFQKPDPVVPLRLRIYWGWKSGPGWQAPSNPRMKFGGASALYKLYVVYRPAPGTKLTKDDPCREFMEVFLPELEQKLSPAS